MNNLERTLSIIKPDAVERNLSEKIKSIFLKNNLLVKDTKKLHISNLNSSSFRCLAKFVCLLVQQRYLLPSWSGSPP